MHNQVLPQNPAQPYDTKCQLDSVRQQQKEPRLSWKQPTAQTFKKQLNRNEVPIATEEQTTRNEHILYYVPPKKCKPGVPTQEGTFVHVAQKMESKEDDKKKNKNNSTKSRKKKETLKGDKDGSHMKQDIKPGKMVGNSKFPLEKRGV